MQLSDSRTISEGPEAIREIADATVEIHSYAGGGIRLAHVDSGTYGARGLEPQACITNTLHIAAPGNESVRASD